MHLREQRIKQYFGKNPDHMVYSETVDGISYKTNTLGDFIESIGVVYKYDYFNNRNEDIKFLNIIIK